MRQKSRILVIALAIIGASMALNASIVIAAPPTPDDIKKGTDAIEKFLKCVNDKIDAKKDAGGIKISDTVECLPGSCTPTLTLTMSEDSAQAACFVGGENGTGTCQLPRVIIKCPGPPQLEFSYLLCGADSEGAEGVVGGNRVEIGAVVGETGSGTVMVMADVPVPPGKTNKIENVISVGTGTANGRGSKRCNACHGDAGIKAAVGDTQLSERIEVFGTTDAPTTARDPSFIIDTDDPKVTTAIEGKPLGNLKGVQVMKQTLSEICDCIDKEPTGGTVTAEVKALCEALKNYQKKGGNHPTPTPPEPTPKPSPTESPSVITLAYFDAEAGDDGTVTLSWETATEIDNAGFNIYRSKHRNGTYTKINNALITAKGDATSGTTYSFADTPRRGTYYYRLEDIDTNGVSIMHDPVRVRVTSGNNTARRR